MTIKHVQRGRLLKSEQDRLIDQVNANTDPGVAGASWASGSRGPVVVIPQRGGQSFQYFELATSLSPGEFAEAYPADINDEGTAYETDLEADTFTVYDVGGRFRGRARGVEVGWDGSKGLAVFRNGRWEIDWLQPLAEWIICLVSADFETGADTISVDTVVVTAPTSEALLPFDVDEVDNIHSWAGADGQTLQAKLDDDSLVYRAVQKDCGSAGVGSGI